MNLSFRGHKKEPRSESFRQYEALSRQLRSLEQRGEGQGEEAGSIRNQMDAPFRGLSAEEIEYFKTDAAEGNGRGKSTSAPGKYFAEYIGKSVLSSSVEIKGSIKFEKELLIDGKVEGEIYSNGVLTIGEHADIHGPIKSKSIIVFGKVEGNIIVSDRCELKACCILHGNLTVARLIVEDGATFVGKSEITVRNALSEARMHGGAKKNEFPKLVPDPVEAAP